VSLFSCAPVEQEGIRAIPSGGAGSQSSYQFPGKAIFLSDATIPPWNVTESSSAPSSPVAGDIYLDDGTNTASGNPGWRRYTGAGWEDVSAAASGGAWSYCKVSDVKTNNTAGGTFTSGSYQTRDINTEDSDTDGICSISSNQITLVAGTYTTYILAPAIAVGGHRTRLYNISDSSTEILGSNAYTNATYGGASYSVIVGEFTIASSKTFEVQHRCQTTRSTDGLGIAMNFSESEVYTVAEFWKIE